MPEIGRDLAGIVFRDWQSPATGRVTLAPRITTPSYDLTPRQVGKKAKIGGDRCVPPHDG